MEIFYSENGIEKSLEVPVLEAAEHEEELMKSNFVKLSWRTEKHTKLPAGSYVIPFPDEKNRYDASDPRYPIKYRLLEPYVPDHEDDLEYKYEALFQHPIMWLSKLPMMLVTGDISSWDSATKKISWGYTGTPQTIANFVVNVINWLATQYPFFGETIGSGWVSLVDSDLIPTVTVNFESVSVMSAASLIAQACDCEFHFDFARKEFRLGSIKVGEQTELISGVNVGLAKVTESKEEFYNAFVIKGSTKNLAQRSQEGENYQILDRLTLDPMKYPDSMMYTDENGDIITRTEFLALGRPILMGELVFDDVYPKLDLYVYKVRERECWKLDENKRKVEDPNGRLDPSDGKRYKSYSKWYIRLAYPIYEIDSEGKRVVTEWKDYLYDKNEQIAGTTLQMSFLANDEEGALTPLMLGQGFFDLVYFENTTTEKEDDDIDPNGFTAQTGDYRIVFHEEGDYIIPTTSSGGIYPQGADTPQLTNNKATLINLNLGEAHKEQAYLDLEMVAKRKVKLMRSDLNNYEMNSDSVWFAKNNPYLYVGLNTLYNDNQGYTLDTHIIKIVTKVDYPFVQTITVGNKKIKGAIATMKEQIQTIIGGSFGGGSGSGSSISEQQLRTLIANLGIEFFLSKQNDDVANGEIGFLQGLWIKAKGLFGFDSDGNIRANEALFSGRVTADNMRSENYTGESIADTGWAIKLENGSSHGVFDYLTIRKKMIVNSLEIKETHATAGDIAQTCASAELARTDYFEVDEQGNYTLLGYAKKRVPWYLKGMAMALSKDKTRSTYLRLFGHIQEIRVTLKPEDLVRCNRIRCYFLAKDGEKDIENWFRVNDLVYCQTWNIVKASRQTYAPDLNDHVGNIFWWRKVTDVSWNTGTPQYFDRNGNKTTNEAEAYVNEGGVKRLATNGTYSATVDDAHSPKELDGNTYHWFDVAYDYEKEQAAFANYKDTGWCALFSDIPALGDKVVQFGNNTDPDRMNITLSEVNGSGNVDAPDIKMYRGVYTFNLEKSWWGGVPCKVKISPSTGVDFYAPHFRFITEVGEARVPFDRPEKFWSSIALERDEYHSTYPDYTDDILDDEGRFVSRGGFILLPSGEKQYGSVSNPIAKNYVRKCYYYDRVTHIGSLWLCSIANETWYWRATEAFGIYQKGDMVTDYASLPDEQKDLCEHVRSYTNQEPGVSAGDWTQQVDKGDEGAFLSRAFTRTNTDISAYHPQGGTKESPIPTSTKDADGEVVSGITWTDGAQDGDLTLWSTTAWFYSDGTHSDWTPPAHETDNQTQDIEFSPSYDRPKPPIGDTPIPKTDRTKKAGDSTHGSRANGSGEAADWYDSEKDEDNTHASWDDMIWRAERQIKNGVYSGDWAISRIKGESSNRLDLTNQADLVSLDADGKVRFARTVTTVARIFEGSTIATENVEKGSTLTAANMKYGSSSTCTVSNIVNGQVTITWNFVKGDTITAGSRLIVMKLRNVEYSTTFSLGSTNSENLYQVVPNPSEVSFSRTSENTLTPSSISLYCGYNKTNGSGTTTVPYPSSYAIGDGNYLYYRAKSSGSWGSWNYYNGGISVSSSTEVTDYEFAISTSSNNPTDNNIYEREIVPIVKDGKHGENALIADLSNEMDSVAMTYEGKVAARTTLYTTFRMFYGTQSQSLTSLSYSGDASGVSVSRNLSSGLVTITISANTQLTDDKNVITLTGTCANGTRSMDFTIQGVRAGSNGEPATTYQLVPSASEIVENPNDSNSRKPSEITCSCTSIKDGTTTNNPSEATIQYSLNGTSWSNYSSAISTSSVTSALYFRLRVNNKDVDKETIPVIKEGQDGENAPIAIVSPSQISIQCDKDGKVLASSTTNLSFVLNIGSTSYSSPTVRAGTLPTGVTYSSTLKRLTVGTTATASGIKEGVTFTLSATHTDGKTYSADCTIALIGALQGIQGEQGVGKDGLQGCVVRTSEWKTYQEYRNDEGVTGLAIGYIDVVAVADSSEQTGYKFYRCKKTHTSYSFRTYTDTEYWEALSNVGPIYTSLLVAKEAYIKFGTGNQFVITDSSGNIQAGMKGDGTYRIWAGTSASTVSDYNVGNAPFRVTSEGKMYATDAEISGKITATSGNITGEMIVGTYGYGYNSIKIVPSSTNPAIVGYVNTTEVFKLGAQIAYDGSTGATLKVGNTYLRDGALYVSDSVGCNTYLWPTQLSIDRMLAGSHYPFSIKIRTDLKVEMGANGASMWPTSRTDVGLGKMYVDGDVVKINMGA